MKIKAKQILYSLKSFFKNIKSGFFPNLFLKFECIDILHWDPLAYEKLIQRHLVGATSFSWISLGFRLAVPSYSMQTWFYANHILCKPLINSTSNDPCYRQVYLCMKIALNIHLTWCAELYIRAIVELEWVNVSENLHDKTGWLHCERFSSILSKNIWSIFFDWKIDTSY